MNLEWKQYEDKLNSELEHAINWLKNEFNKIRTGRATPSLVDGVKVIAYDTATNLNELATVQIPEPRVLLIKPFDPSLTKEIAKAVAKFNPELNPIVDDKLIRISLAAPTEESRKKAVKLIKEYLEKAKITIRNGRKSVQSSIKAAKYQEGLETILLENLDQAVKKANDALEDLFKAKEKDLLTI